MKQFTVKNLKKLSVAVCSLGILAGALVLPVKAMAAETDSPATITLPVPYTKDGITVKEALDRRRSSRQFTDAPLQEKQLSVLLWAANGINRPESGKRVNPTTMGIYNIDVYAVMADGIYKYDPAAHALTQVSPVDFRPQIVHTAPLTLFYVANPVPPRDPSRPVNPERQLANNCLVAGTMLQSVALVAVDEGLGTCVRGSVDREAFRKAAGLSPEQTVLISQTVGALH